MEKKINVCKPVFEVVPDDKKIHKGNAVMCISTGEVFKSAKATAKKYDLSYQCVTMCCRGEINSTGAGSWGFRKKNGMDFVYVRDMEYKANVIAEHIRKQNAEIVALREENEKYKAKIEAVEEIRDYALAKEKEAEESKTLLNKLKELLVG